MTGADRGRRRARHNARIAGYSMFEFAVAVIVIGVLAVMLSERLLVYQEYSEKTAMELTVRNIRSGLRYRVADLMNRDLMRDADRVLLENPITWLEEPPANYVGELRNPAPDQITPGSWYFDAAQHELVYLPRNHRFLKPAKPGDYAIRYRVTAVRNRNIIRQGSEPSVESLALTLLNDYRWDWPK